MSELKSKAKNIQRVLASSDTGPLLVARDVVALAAGWARYEAEAQMSAKQWIKQNLGRELRFFVVREKAVDKIGEHARRCLHHDVAVWVSQNVPDDKLTEVMRALMAAKRNNGGNCVQLRAAVNICNSVMGVRVFPRAPGCSRCRMLEALLWKHGVTIPE